LPRDLSPVVAAAKGDAKFSFQGASTSTISESSLASIRSVGSALIAAPSRGPSSIPFTEALPFAKAK
jgi:hypothetical protein